MLRIIANLESGCSFQPSAISQNHVQMIALSCPAESRPLMAERFCETKPPALGWRGRSTGGAQARQTGAGRPRSTGGVLGMAIRNCVFRFTRAP
jgi:hypothetical protein